MSLFCIFKVTAVVTFTTRRNTTNYPMDYRRVGRFLWYTLYALWNKKYLMLFIAQCISDVTTLYGQTYLNSFSYFSQETIC